MCTADPVIHAALNWTLAGPDAALAGTRKSTRYVFTSPGHPIALTTSAAWPFTVAATGELTTTSGFAGYAGNG